MRMEYINPPLGTATLLANLQNEGLVIMDERKAFAFLENVSYFRFAAYLRPFKALDKHGYKEFDIVWLLDKIVFQFRQWCCQNENSSFL